MTEIARSAVERLARDLAGVVYEFEDEVGGSPTLGELLEVIGLSVPSTDAMAGVTAPMRLRATLVGGKRYRDRGDSRVSELNDAVFVHASEFLAEVGNHLLVAGAPVSADDVAAQLGVALRHADCVLADVRCADVAGVVVVGQKKAVRAAIGDVVAIPAIRGGFHFASIVARNRFGTALGIWRGVRSSLVIRASDKPAESRVFFTDEVAIKNGSWPLVGHSQEALALFPGDPEYYYPPSPHYPDNAPRVGEFGAAEKSDGTLRDVSREEALRIGLLDGTYRPAHTSNYLPEVLAAEL